MSALLVGAAWSRGGAQCVDDAGGGASGCNCENNPGNCTNGGDVCERPNPVYPLRCCPPSANCGGTNCFGGGPCGSITVSQTGPGCWSISPGGISGCASGTFGAGCGPLGNGQSYTMSAPGAVSGNGAVGSVAGCGGSASFSVVFCSRDCSCASSTCGGSSCSDGCGGTCPGTKTCNVADCGACSSNGDCASGNCSGGQCAPAGVTIGASCGTNPCGGSGGYSCGGSCTNPAPPSCFVGTCPKSCPTCPINWTDTNPTTIRAIHVNEIRDCINFFRIRDGLSLFPWTDPSVLNVRVKAVHFTEMRTAISEVYSNAHQTPPTWIDPVLVDSASKVRQVHIMELRSAVTGAP